MLKFQRIYIFYMTNILNRKNETINFNRSRFLTSLLMNLILLE